MIKRNWIGLLLITCIAVACKNEKPKIGFILPNLNNKRYVIEKNFAEEKSKEKGAELLFASSDNDEQKQIDQFEEMLNNGAKVIILDPVNRFTAAVMVRKAHEAGVKVISYDRLIVGCRPDAFISFDARKIGELMANYAILRKPKGKYVVLNGDKSDINAVWIQEGIEKQLQPLVSTNAITVTFSMFVEYWNGEDAKHLLNKCLKLSGDTPSVIISSSDLMTRGCIEALEKASIDPRQLVITGQNAEPYACKAIKNGKQTMTIYKPVRQLADLAFEIAISMINNESTSKLLPQTVNNGTAEIPTRLLEGVVIDSTSLDVLIKENYLKADELK
ncbi:MAG: substrate-binding domain-containing protein [Bacteroidales bacterium]|nr:substrate-binding domain-containing protein [Bacteroidales bacterium]